MIMFKLNIEPPRTTAQASHRIIKPKDRAAFIGSYQSGKWRVQEKEFMYLMKPFAPRKPMTGPLWLIIKWVYPYRKADKKWIKEGKLHSCDTRPDTDNLEKGIKDVMGKLNYFNDDSQVARSDFWKQWGTNPHIFISIESIE